ncbi:lytic transglycosylase domain-containing protein [Roseobacteraceae bacterium S113]
MRWVLVFLVVLPLVAFASPRESAPGRMCSEGNFGPVECVRAAHFSYDICTQIERQALRHGIDPNFYARLLWQESRFDRNALSHANAMGIAQFIRSTADLRGLRDPYNPAAALEHSAEYLGDMARRFGNIGYAAIGYNGGERRAERVMGGNFSLPRETSDYVRIITGLSAQDWHAAPDAVPDLRLDGDRAFVPACLALAANRRISKLQITPPEPDLAKWGAQLAFGKSKSAARVNFKRVTQNCRAVRGERIDVIYVENRVRGRPGYYMARVSRQSRDAAYRICKRARDQGCSCAVYKNY